MFMIVAIEERKGETVIKTSKRRSSGMTCSQMFRHYASELLRAMFMIVAIEERRKETVIKTSNRRSSGMICS